MDKTKVVGFEEFILGQPEARLRKLPRAVWYMDSVDFGRYLDAICSPEPKAVAPVLDEDENGDTEVDRLHAREFHMTYDGVLGMSEEEVFLLSL